LSKLETQITEEEQKQIADLLKDIKLEELKPLLEALTMTMRAIKGQPIEQTDFISGLMNLKDIRERTRFNTQIILRRQVYLRLLTQYSGCQHFTDWADEEAHDLISYKGQGRQEAIDYKKAEKAAEAGMVQPGVFAGTILEREKPQPPKKRFWQRGPKPESLEVEQ
jgi:hypothetical protein